MTTRWTGRTQGASISMLSLSGEATPDAEAAAAAARMGARTLLLTHRIEDDRRAVL